MGVALALGLAVVSPAAASVWTPVANVSEEGQSAYEPQVAMDAAGDAIAVWARFNGINDVVQAAVRPAGGSWGSPATLSEAGQEASEPHVAVDAAGDATVVWRRFNGSNDVVQAAVRPAGEPWGTPTTLSEAGQEAHAPEVAVDPTGQAIAVWIRDDVVQAAFKPAGGPWAKSATVSQTGQDASEPQVAVDATGDATVVWTRYIGQSSGGMSKYAVQAAVKPTGATWEAPAIVSEESEEEGLEPQVAVDAAGDATAIWKRFIYGYGRPIETAVKPAGKPWGTPTAFESGGHPQVDVNAAGDTIATWTKYYGPGDVVQATVKPVGQPWVKPASISEDETSAPQVATDAGGDATVVWTRYVGFGFGKFVVQAAQYSPSTAFTIETLQKLSNEPTYTKAELNGKVADTVDYKTIVKNTGSTNLQFGALKDSACESISPAGPTELAASAEETFTCTHKLTAFVKYSDKASIEGNEGTGTKTSNSVTVALAPVFEAPAATADSSGGSCVESRVAVFVCSDLRAAIAYADAEPDSTVKLERGIYQLGEANGYPSGVHAFLQITAGITIQGAGPGETTIEQTDGRDPVIIIPYSAGFSQIEIEGVKITGGVAAGEDDGEFGENGGGAIMILGSGTESSSVTLTNDDLTGNLAHADNAMGGAIFNARTLNVIDSTITHNVAHAENPGSTAGEALGGGIFNTGHLLVADSTIAYNTVEAGGSKSEAMGGGLDSGVGNFSKNATAVIANTTITGNIASAGTTTTPPLVYGGGLAIDRGTLEHVTLYDNTASPVNAWESWGGNVYQPQGGGASISSSIVADGSASEGPNCMFQAGGSPAEDNRNNLLEGSSGECGFTLEYDPLLNVNPKLTPLAENGGPTQTMAPEPGSAAIDATTECEGIAGDDGSGGWATATIPLDVDQRGMPRNSHCDIGAFQTEPPSATTPPQLSGIAEPGETLTCTSGTWTGEGTLTYSYEWLRNGLSTGDKTTSYTIEPSDAESQIACLVTVSGTYGAREATSTSVEVRPPPPTVAPSAASSVTQTTATLNATINPNGGRITKCEFDYGPTESYARSVPCATLPGSGDSAVAVSASISGLVASTTYHFRVVASNSGGTSDSTSGTFTTSSNPPVSAPGDEKHEEEATAKTGVLGFNEALPNATLTNTSPSVTPDGDLSVEVSCPAETISCTGTITLKTLNAVSKAKAHKSKTRKAAILTIAVGSFNVTGGHVATIKLHFSRKARTLLSHTPVLRARATVVAHDPAGATHTTQTTLTIRAAKIQH
ncbi:MAG: choice-of-anchor Q domain-containing protein [Solirubrobacteraceae bacterium]